MKKLMVAAALMMTCTGFAPPWNAGTPFEFTPTPVEGAYPACSGDEDEDRCIQLYERGMNTAYNRAQNAEGGELSQHAMAEQSDMAMGGPYEPMENDTAGGWEEDEWPETASRNGYPPCSGDEDDDRCIQLYEGGVTGMGN